MGSASLGAWLAVAQDRSRPLFVAPAASALEPPDPAAPALSVPADSPRWKLEGRAEVTDYQGRKSILLNGGGATLQDFAMRDGVVDVDVATPASRGFFGIQFRIADDDANAEWVYLRQHKSGAIPTPCNTRRCSAAASTGSSSMGRASPARSTSPKTSGSTCAWRFRGPRRSSMSRTWTRPALVMDDLKSGIQKGQLALAVLIGETYFSNFEVRTTPDAPWERHLPPTPPGTLTRWSLSPEYDALARDVERPLSAAESDAIPWREVEAEPPGLVVLYRYYEAPHLRVSFANDFSKRLEPQPGTKVLVRADHASSPTATR